MSRTLRAKRIYALGQYQNIEFSDELSDIPDELSQDQTYISLLEYLQLLHIEKRINDYYLIRKRYGELSPEEALALLESEITDTKLALIKHIQGE